MKGCDEWCISHTYTSGVVIQVIMYSNKGKIKWLMEGALRVDEYIARMKHMSYYGAG